MFTEDTDLATEEEVERRADAIFDALDDYGRGTLAAHGTAFTTYEEHGDAVCAALRRRAAAWRTAQEEMVDCQHDE